MINERVQDASVKAWDYETAEPGQNTRAIDERSNDVRRAGTWLAQTGGHIMFMTSERMFCFPRSHRHRYDGIQGDSPIH
jgi:hypothetical protein